MSTVQDALPTPVVGAVVGESAPPVIRKRLSPEADLDLDDLFRPAASPRDALLNMADVLCPSTRCIGSLMNAHRRLRSQGRRLVLHSVPLRAFETLRFLQLDEVLTIVDDEAAGLELLRTDAA